MDKKKLPSGTLGNNHQISCENKNFQTLLNEDFSSFLFIVVTRSVALIEKEYGWKQTCFHGVKLLYTLET